MKRVQVICGVVTLLASGPANAEWYKIATSDSQSVWFMDPERTKVDGQMVQAWIRIDASNDRSVKWREAKELISFNCAAQTYKRLSIVAYDTYGKIVGSDSSPDYGYGIGYQPIVPESMAESASQMACLAVSPKQ